MQRRQRKGVKVKESASHCEGIVKEIGEKQKVEDRKLMKTKEEIYRRQKRGVKTKGTEVNEMDLWSKRTKSKGK